MSEMGKRNKGLGCVPGDRGDANQNDGISKMRSGFSDNLKADQSKGYDSAPSGWGGKVER